MTDTLKTVQALEAARDYIESSICFHENTHRGGVLWTICDDCGRKWADDRGGFKKPTMPSAYLKVTEALAQLHAAPAPYDGVTTHPEFGGRAQAAPAPCQSRWWSSAACSLGTKSCEVEHGGAQTAPAQEAQPDPRLRRATEMLRGLGHRHLAEVVEAALKGAQPAPAEETQPQANSDERLQAIASEFERAIPTQGGKILAAMISEGVTALQSHIEYAIHSMRAQAAPAQPQAWESLAELVAAAAEVAHHSERLRSALEPFGVEVQPAPASAQEAQTTTPQALVLNYPLRPEYLAQVVVPRDLKANEAQRLCEFVRSMAQQ